MASVMALAYWWLHRRNSRKTTKTLAELNPLKLSLGADGLQTTQKAGATSFQPWSAFRGFREGKAIFLLQLGAGAYQVVPKTGLAPEQVETLRAALRSHLTETG